MRRWGALGFLLLPALTPLPAAAQEVGTAGAVNPATTGTPPGRASRTLELGSRVVFRERITTTANGTAQLIFVDKSTINVGPGSDLVIDEFVYDPATGTGRMSATLARGLVRFVGGAASHTGGAQIRTPVATIGIRGGVGTIEHRACRGGECAAFTQAGGPPPRGVTTALNSFGTMNVTNAGGNQTITRPGFVVQTFGTGTPPEPPRRITLAEVSQFNAQLTSKPGQSGGRAPPSPAAIQQAQASTVGPVLATTETTTASVQGQNAARQVSQGAAAGLATTPGSATSPTQISQVSSGVNRQVTAQEAQEQAPATAASSGNQGNGGAAPSPAPPGPPPPARSFALNMSIDPSLGSPAPYLPAGFVASGNFYNSPVLGHGTGGSNPDGTPNRTSRVLQAGLNITGQGANQVSTIYVFAGVAYESAASGLPTFGGGFTATTRRSPTQGFPGRANGGFVGNESDVVFNSDFTPTSITGRPGDLDSGDRVVREPAFFFPGTGGGQTNYDFVQTATAAAAPAGLGQNRPTVQLSGIAVGLMRTSDITNTPTAIAPAFAFEGTMSIPLDGSTSRFGVTIAGDRATGGAANTFSSATLPIGFGGADTRGGRGTYVDYDNFGGRETRRIDGSFPATVNGQAVESHRGLLVTSATVDAASFFPGVTFCQCDFTRWGFWSSDTIRTNANGSRNQDLLHLGTWVAGQPTAVGQLPATGSAIYTGHAIATIQNGSAQYIAAGNFSNNVNFATGIGAAAVTGFDGRTYTGNTQIQSGSTQFLGSLSSSDRTMQLQGQFGRGATGPAGEMAGGLRIDGPNYLGSGIFAGRSF